MFIYFNLCVEMFTPCACPRPTDVRKQHGIPLELKLPMDVSHCASAENSLSSARAAGALNP